MKILYFGSSTFAQPPLLALQAAGHDIVAVVTQPDRPAGRGGKLTPPPVKETALALSLPTLQPESCREQSFLAQVRAMTPDLSVVAAYGQFLPEALLETPRYGSINLHGSLLPKYRGAAPIQRAIWQGEDHSGVCLIWMVRAMDAGDIIACVDETIRPEDNTGTLSARLAHRAAELLVAWLPTILAGTAPRHPQDAGAVTFAPAIRKEERGIDWQAPAVSIWRQIRALAPAPAAMTHFRGQPIKISAAKLLHVAEGKEGIAGVVSENNPKVGLHVSTGAGSLEILTLQPPGKRPMTGADFLRGYHVSCGESFASVNPANGSGEGG